MKAGDSKTLKAMERFTRAHDLSRDGYTKRNIAKMLGVKASTVAAYLKHPSYREYENTFTKNRHEAQMAERMFEEVYGGPLGKVPTTATEKQQLPGIDSILKDMRQLRDSMPPTAEEIFTKLLLKFVNQGSDMSVEDLIKFLGKTLKIKTE